MPLDVERTRRAREELLRAGLLGRTERNPDVRDIIERSWRRCIGEAVPTEPDLVYRDPADGPTRLRDAAAPVLQRLGDHLADVRVAMFVSNDSGQIVMRRANEPRQRNLLDRASAAEGFDFSEPSIGTNGLGTVIAERSPVVVRGSEHYNPALEPFTCAGTPIFEPFTRRVLGTFALCCDTLDSSPLMYGIATDVGRQIEANLTAMLGAHERALIHSYLMANQAARDPVIVVNERTAFASTAGLPYLTSESHALLWTHLRAADVPPGPQRLRVPLQSGWCEAVVERVGEGAGEQGAYCVRLLTGRPGAAERRGGRPSGRPPRAWPAGRAAPAPSPESVLHPVPAVAHQLAEAARHDECLAIAGGPGTGKLHAASAVLASRYREVAPLVLDASGFRDAEWFGRALDALAAGRAVVLRHLEDLPPAEVNRVKGVAAHARGAASKGTAGAVPAGALILTVDPDAAAAHVQTLISQVATTVRLPGLQEMRDHIPALVAGALAGLPEPAADTRFSSDALQVLMRWHWPGNIAELRRTVELVARRQPGATVGAAALPGPMQQLGRRRAPGLMEAAERQAIVTALRRSGGNRSRAAELLGIGRTTLYRKMQEHGLDG